MPLFRVTAGAEDQRKRADCKGMASASSSRINSARWRRSHLSAGAAVGRGEHWHWPQGEPI